VTLSVGLKDYTIPAEASALLTPVTGSITVKFEIFDECTEAVLNSVDEQQVFEVIIMEAQNITFSPFTTSGNSSRNCDTPTYTNALLVDTHPSVEKVLGNFTITNYTVPVLLDTAVKNTLVADYLSLKSFEDTVTHLRLRIAGSLKWKNAFYPEKTIEIKLTVKPCRVTKIVPGDFGTTKLPIRYTLPAGGQGFLQASTAEVLKFTFSQFTYEPSTCQTDSGKDLEFVFTPFMENSGAYEQTSIANALQASV